MEVKPNTIFNERKIFFFQWFCSVILAFFVSCHTQYGNGFEDPPSFSVSESKAEYLTVPANLQEINPSSLPKDSWKQFETHRMGMVTIPGNDLWIRFPDHQLFRYKNPALFIEIALESPTVYQNDKKVYSFRERDYVFPHIIPLSGEPGGYIYIHCKSSYKGYIGLDGKVRLEEYSQSWIQLLRDNAARTFLSPVLVVLSLLFLGLFFLRWEERIYLYFSILLLSSAIVEVMNGFIAFSLFNYSRITIPLIYINFAIYPILLLLFLKQIYPVFFKNLFEIMIFVHVLVYVYSLLASWNSGISFLNAEWNYSWWVILEGIIAILISIYVLIRGDSKLKLVTWGLLAIVITGSHDTLVDMNVFPWKQRIIHQGFWMMILLFGFFVFRYYWNILNSIDSFNKELQKKNKDLERLFAIDKDMALAKELQRSLLSDHIKEDENINLVAFTQSLHSIGGDYFDHDCDSLGNWGILLCDVAGHGISSAVVAAMSKMAFTGAKAYIQYPTRVFNFMNRHLSGKTKGLFITASYLFIDTETGKLVYSNAGHPGFFILRNNSAALLEHRAKGKPLGVFGESEYKEESTQLLSGDKIFLYTDGVLDLNNDKNESFNEERLKQLLWENKNLPIQNLKTTVQNSLSDFCKSWEHQEDDVSFIIIEYKNG
ncbi:PP2C family protein-serine/threonine phosphatase [Leptospira ilyithenensis]|uniref:Serine/threonine-protein phosphatase n=1 Tax=Leptospira ilyithenensis TaxID=2484901 RepID=A0A4R9LQ33_9LEPT|nr:SpoIIE family protein phosphatase [Leptospira ilyithenensis]TGN11131.1 serine/threonine-protein phosphatase [Leptospira ilyithenensis]